jgi:hypothetical protein
VAGCTSLLGDFETGPDQSDAGSGSEGGGADAQPMTDATGTPDGTGVLDAPSDVNANTDAESDDGGATDGGDAGDAATDAGPLDCSTWAYSTPIVLETLGGTGNRLVQGPLAIYTIPVASGTNVRIVAGKSGTVPFSVYSLDRSGTNPVVTTISPANTYFSAVFSAVHRSPGKASTYTVVLASTRASSMVSATYEAFVLQDSLPNAGPVPNPFAVYQLTPVQATPTSMHILPLAPNDLFTLVENPVANAGVTTYALGAGIATTSAPIAALSPVSSSLNADDFTNDGLLNDSVNNMVYIYSQNDLSSPGMSAWSVSSTAAPDAAAPAKRAIGAISAIMPSIAENTTQVAADIAYLESSINGSFVNGETFRAGTIPYSGATPDLDTWVSTDLPVVKAYNGSGVYDAPVGVNDGSRWGSDNIMMVGPGLKTATDASNGGVPYGLNALWMDATGALRAEQRGPTRLLPDLGDFSGVATTPITIGAQGKTARWAVAWVENKTDDAGSYSVVSYNELICQ